ncbi:MAG: hypothetical protein ACFFDN_51745, partial [Candidatus Hodarchaeota archaeon]
FRGKGNSMEENNKFKEEIWKIRDLIQKLEDVKDEIIKYLNSQKELDDSTKRMWISDAKEFYYFTVSSWEMLRAASEGKAKYLDSSKNFLSGAKSRLAQSMSEIKYFKEKKASNLILQANEAFEKCWDAISSKLEKLTPEKEIKKPIERIIKISDKEYQLPCSVCGKIAFAIKIGTTQFDKEEKLVYTGITHQSTISLEHAETIFDLLEKEKIGEFHTFMKNHRRYEGMDAYCPKCEKIYCWDHYNAVEEFDDGFYDCTYGTCPNGHRRIIDD